MGNRAMARRVLASLLLVRAGLGSPLLSFAETHTQTVQVLIRIPERHPTAAPLLQPASLPAREQAIASAIAAHTTLASVTPQPGVTK